MDNLTPSPNTQSQNTHDHNHYHFFNHSFIKWAVIAVIELIIIIAVFALGLKVGLRESRFAQSWERNYSSNFGGPTPMFSAGSHMMMAHGLVGTIISIASDNKSFIIKDQNNEEKTVILSATTTIRHNLDTLKPQDLKTSNQVIIIGEANDHGQIEAKFIRVLN